jgi:hypothetical protein
MIHSIPIVFDMLKIISKICPWLLRRYYTSERLDPLIKLDVSSSGERVNYNFHSQEGSCWLTATNLSPFDFTIDRMEVDVVIDSGASFSCTKIMPEVLKGTGNQQIYVKSTSSMLAETAQRAKDSKRARIEIQAFIVSSIRSFTIRRSIADVSNVRVLA